MIVVGDVHGKVNQFLDIVADYRQRSTELIIQLGDLGFQKQWDEVRQYCRDTNETNLRIIPGNHDDYKRYSVNYFNNEMQWCRTEPLLVEDVWDEEYMNCFSVRGANSIDKYLRKEGRDWFPEEELSYTQLGKAVDDFIIARPEYMFSHTCPSSIKKQLFGYAESSRTEQALQVMFELHEPEYWFFGHFHSFRDEVINGTRFICLTELQTFEL